VKYTKKRLVFQHTMCYGEKIREIMCCCVTPFTGVDAGAAGRTLSPSLEACHGSHLRSPEHLQEMRYIALVLKKTVNLERRLALPELRLALLGSRAHPPPEHLVLQLASLLLLASEMP
jgi:hypothetical protein